MARRTKRTYRIRYWRFGKAHHTAVTYATKREAQHGLASFRQKHSTLRTRIVPQTVVC